MCAIPPHQGRGADRVYVRGRSCTKNVLWRAQAIPEAVAANKLQADQLLVDVNAFLVALPPPDWKTRVAQNVPLGEMPLRTVKTILHELVLARGADILMQLGQVPDADRRCAAARVWPG